jgi:hypothetical protein
MSRANSNSSRASLGAASEVGKEKVVEQVTDKSVSAGTVSAGAISKETVSLARIDRLRNSMPGKDTLIDELIDLFVADLPKRLGAITHAVERGNAPALVLEAHAPATLDEVSRESARVLDALLALKSGRSIELGAVPRPPGPTRLVR